jgi:hypothetical protein
VSSNLTSVFIDAVAQWVEQCLERSDLPFVDSFFATLPTAGWNTSGTRHGARRADNSEAASLEAMSIWPTTSPIVLRTNPSEPGP